MRLARSIRGFTLRELLIVLILIGIVIRVTMPNFNLTSTFDAAGYADQTEALIRFAQKTAIAQRRWVAISFNNSPPTICSQTYSFTPLTYPSCQYPCTGANNATVALPGGLVRTARATTDERLFLNGSSTNGGQLCFDARGRPFSVGTNSPLSASNSFYLEIKDSGTLLRTITIEPETGYVH